MMIDSKPYMQQIMPLGLIRSCGVTRAILFH